MPPPQHDKLLYSLHFTHATTLNLIIYLKLCYSNTSQNDNQHAHIHHCHNIHLIIYSNIVYIYTLTLSLHSKSLVPSSYLFSTLILHIHSTLLSHHQLAHIVSPCYLLYTLPSPSQPCPPYSTHLLCGLKQQWQNTPHYIFYHNPLITCFPLSCTSISSFILAIPITLQFISYQNILLAHITCLAIPSHQFSLAHLSTHPPSPTIIIAHHSHLPSHPPLAKSEHQWPPHGILPSGHI